MREKHRADVVGGPNSLDAFIRVFRLLSADVEIRGIVDEYIESVMIRFERISSRLD